MRIRNQNDTLSVHAIAGTHCILLALDVKDGGSSSSDNLSDMMSGMALESKAANSPTRKTRSLSSSPTPLVNDTSITSIFLGFSIDRKDTITDEIVSLNANGKPIQKLHFGDYTVLPGHEYEYTICKMTKDLDSEQFVVYGTPITVNITTEDPAKGKHGIYFNRGVAGSKAYSQKFGPAKYHLVKKYGVPIWKSTINPRSIGDPTKSKEALAWLSRGLEEALVQFIAQASGNKYRLLATVYEFTHPETLQAFAEAVERGVDVKIIRHCKGTYRTKVKRNDIVKDDSGKIEKEWISDSTTDSARKAIDSVGFSSLDIAHTWQHDTFIERKHSAGIMHNKFIILVENGKPIQVVSASDAHFVLSFTCHAFPTQCVSSFYFLSGRAPLILPMEECTASQMWVILLEMKMLLANTLSIGITCHKICQVENIPARRLMMTLMNPWMNGMDASSLISKAQLQHHL